MPSCAKVTKSCHHCIIIPIKLCHHPQHVPLRFMGMVALGNALVCKGTTTFTIHKAVPSLCHHSDKPLACTRQCPRVQRCCLHCPQGVPSSCQHSYRRALGCPLCAPSTALTGTRQCHYVPRLATMATITCHHPHKDVHKCPQKNCLQATNTVPTVATFPRYHTHKVAQSFARPCHIRCLEYAQHCH